jgi:hypothetical protein
MAQSVTLSPLRGGQERLLPRAAGKKHHADGFQDWIFPLCFKEVRLHIFQTNSA